MEPVLFKGDLVIIRDNKSYEIGDIVTYQHPKVGPIIHRIIDRKGDRYILQGDNYDWIDTHHPDHSELIGESWIQIPGAATFIDKLRQPLPLSILSLVFAGAILSIFRREKPENEKVAKKISIQDFSASLNLEELGNVFLIGLGILCLGGILLASSAFTRPILTTIPADIPFEHSGRFRYCAVAPPGINDDDTLKTGDPVFHSAVREFDILFDYQFKTPSEHSVWGESSLVMEIGEVNGWTRKLVSQPVILFKGSEVSLRATVDLDDVFEIIYRM